MGQGQGQGVYFLYLNRLQNLVADDYTIISKITA